MNDEPVVDDVTFIVTNAGTVVIAEALALFVADDYDMQRGQFDVWGEIDA